MTNTLSDYSISVIGKTSAEMFGTETGGRPRGKIMIAEIKDLAKRCSLNEITILDYLFASDEIANLLRQETLNAGVKPETYTANVTALISEIANSFNLGNGYGN